ncbi:TIR domain-containing protein [Oxalobacter vibrioformis]|uniref:TIR domain-containing protein n=1 Tax=Oxalobacter vibrioformis TaxID=933080 RepID=A0A9E9P5C3_9BURK|nr:TIR domain-containing protein [Oxalobacter vibrioformis]WAW10951.1 TIR domain-containing protein [Oxalobacter vibrioformis]
MATYPLFVSYSWLPDDGTQRLYGLLENYRIRHVPDFAYELFSVSKDDPVQHLPSKKALAMAIEEKMRPCSCLLILAGVFEEYKRWIDLELDTAKKLKKPVILVEAADPKHTSSKEKRAAVKIVKWDVQELGEAIEAAVGKS